MAVRKKRCPRCKGTDSITLFRCTNKDECSGAQSSRNGLFCSMGECNPETNFMNTKATCPDCGYDRCRVVGSIGED